MNITIFEYATGGGFKENGIESDILSEGYSMLKFAIDDFKKRGFKVKTIVDSRLNHLIPNLKPNEYIEVSQNDDLEKELRNASDKSDFSLVIAPESSGILSCYVRITEKYSIAINSDPKDIDLVSNKERLMKILEKNNLPVPKSHILSTIDLTNYLSKEIKKTDFPKIIKPINETGGRFLNIINTERELNIFFSMIQNENKNKEFLQKYLVQEFVEGLPVSVSLIKSDKDVIPLSLNFQNFLLKSPGTSSRYLGGIVPINHALKEKAFRLAAEAVKLFDGLKGYIGVDMILSHKGPKILEINPRLTTSYIGIKMASENNLAELMLKSVNDSKFNTSIEFNKVVLFNKISKKNDLKHNSFRIIYPGGIVKRNSWDSILLATECLNEAEAFYILSKLNLQNNIF